MFMITLWFVSLPFINFSNLYIRLVSRYEIIFFCFTRKTKREDKGTVGGCHEKKEHVPGERNHGHIFTGIGLKTKAFFFYPYYFLIINPILTYPLNSEIKFILKGREKPFKKAEKNHTAGRD